jgi:hypothetical protein
MVKAKLLFCLRDIVVRIRIRTSWLTEPDPARDPALFVSDLQFFFAYYPTF